MEKALSLLLEDLLRPFLLDFVPCLLLKCDQDVLWLLVALPHEAFADVIDLRLKESIRLIHLFLFKLRFSDMPIEFLFSLKSFLVQSLPIVDDRLWLPLAELVAFNYGKILEVLYIDCGVILSRVRFQGIASLLERCLILSLEHHLILSPGQR